MAYDPTTIVPYLECLCGAREDDVGQDAPRACWGCGGVTMNRNPAAITMEARRAKTLAASFTTARVQRKSPKCLILNHTSEGIIA